MRPPGPPPPPERPLAHKCLGPRHCTDPAYHEPADTVRASYPDRLVPEDLKTRTREAAVEAGQVELTNRSTDPSLPEPCVAAASDAWPGSERCWTRWPDIPRGWCRPCKTAQSVQEMGTPAAGFTRVGGTVYPHGTLGELTEARLVSWGPVTDPPHPDWRVTEVDGVPVPKLSEVSLELLALTADYAADHPLRQAVARLVTRLALLEGKIATAAEVLAEGIQELAVTSEPEHPAMAKALEILKR